MKTQQDNREIILDSMDTQFEVLQPGVCSMVSSQITVGETVGGTVGEELSVVGEISMTNIGGDGMEMVTRHGNVLKDSNGKIYTYSSPQNAVQILESKIISGSNAFQQTISTYPAIQYFGSSLGFKLPDIHSTNMAFAHILAGVTKFIYSLAKFGDSYNPGILAASIVPTVQYVGSSMVTDAFKNLNQSQEMCAVHGALQIALNDLAKATYLYSIGSDQSLQASVPSLLYGGLHIVASCGENKVQSNNTKVGDFYSLGAAFVVGAAVMTYHMAAPLTVMQAFSVTSNFNEVITLRSWSFTNLLNFQNYAAFLKGVTAASVTDKLFRVLFSTYDNSAFAECLEDTNSLNNKNGTSVNLVGESVQEL